MFADRPTSVANARGTRDLSAPHPGRYFYLRGWARECTREVSGGGGASGESEDEVADERERERELLNGAAGFRSLRSALSVRHVGASTFKMQIRERRSGRKRRRKRKSAGWQVFYWGQLPLLCFPHGVGAAARCGAAVAMPRRR